MGLLTKEIESKIIEILPNKCCIMVDGWSEGSEHFFAIFACFPENGKCRSLLPSFAPPLQEDDLSAKSLQGLIVVTLSVFNKTMNNVVSYSGDNCSVYMKLSTDTNIPLIGCASHRLNLVIQQYFKIHSRLLNNIDQLMKRPQRLNSQHDFGKNTSCRSQKKIY